MAMMTVKYFSGTDELTGIHTLKRAQADRAWPALKVKRQDSFSSLIGHPLSGPDAIYPVTRIIEYKRNPSKHKCDARCTHAKGRQCECSCGGQFHGSMA